MQKWNLSISMEILLDVSCPWFSVLASGGKSASGSLSAAAAGGFNPSVQHANSFEAWETLKPRTNDQYCTCFYGECASILNFAWETTSQFFSLNTLVKLAPQPNLKFSTERCAVSFGFVLTCFRYNVFLTNIFTCLPHGEVAEDYKHEKHCFQIQLIWDSIDLKVIWDSLDLWFQIQVIWDSLAFEF